MKQKMEKKIEKKIVHQFLTPPRRGRKFEMTINGKTKVWQVVLILRKMGNVGYRYEVLAELQYIK